MPTPLDRALQSKTAFWGMCLYDPPPLADLKLVMREWLWLTRTPGFAGIIGVVSAWAIYGGDMFPQQVQAPPSASSTSRQQATSEPTGGMSSPRSSLSFMKWHFNLTLSRTCADL